MGPRHLSLHLCQVSKGTFDARRQVWSIIHNQAELWEEQRAAKRLRSKELMPLEEPQGLGDLALVLALPLPLPL